jgi:hypothetical protein
VQQRGRRLTTHGASDTVRKISAVLCADGRVNFA